MSNKMLSSQPLLKPIILILLLIFKKTKIYQKASKHNFITNKIQITSTAVEATILFFLIRKNKMETIANLSMVCIVLHNAIAYLQYAQN